MNKTEMGERVARIEAVLDEIRIGIEKLNICINVGNGKPSLKDRLTRIETIGSIMWALLTTGLIWKIFTK